MGTKYRASEVVHRDRVARQDGPHLDERLCVESLGEDGPGPVSSVDARGGRGRDRAAGQVP